MNVKDLADSFGIFIDNNLSYYVNKTPSRLPILHLDVTERCNARCRMCNLWKKDSSLAGKELTIKQIEALAQVVKKLGCLVFSLGGGEPLLRGDIFEIIEIITSYGISVHMDTNGILLDEGSIRRLSDAGLKVISISLDSHNPGVHNNVRGVECFDSVVKSIRLIKEIAPQIKVIVNTVISKKNVDHLFDIFNLAVQLKVDGIKFNPIHNVAKQSDLGVSNVKDMFFCKEDIHKLRFRIKELLRLIRKSELISSSPSYLKKAYCLYLNDSMKQKCFAGITTCLVMPYGDVSACYNFYNQDKVIGNIKNTNFLNIWNSEDFRQLRKDAKRCKEICWDTCTQEPSLRLSLTFLLKNFKLVLKETDMFC